VVGDARSVMGPRLAPRRRAGMEAAGLPFDGGEQGSESGRTGCNNRVGWVEELALWPGGLVLPEGRDEMIIGMISEGREIRHLETKRFILASSSESKSRRVEQSSSRKADCRLLLLRSSGIRTRVLRIQMRRGIHYSTAPIVEWHMGGQLPIFGAWCTQP
jgi:hypothetical protein